MQRIHPCDNPCTIFLDDKDSERHPEKQPKHIYARRGQPLSDVLAGAVPVTRSVRALNQAIWHGAHRPGRFWRSLAKRVILTWSATMRTTWTSMGCPWVTRPALTVTRRRVIPSQRAALAVQGACTVRATMTAMRTRSPQQPYPQFASLRATRRLK